MPKFFGGPAAGQVREVLENSVKIVERPHFQLVKDYTEPTTVTLKEHVYYKERVFGENNQMFYFMRHEDLTVNDVLIKVFP